MKDFKSSFLSLIIVLLSVFTMKAQPVENMDELKPNRILGFAESAKRVGDYWSAIVFYEKYFELRPESPKTAYDLAEVYRQINNYEGALQYYQMAYDYRPNKYMMGLFYMARMNKSLGNYELALEQFETFKKESRGVIDDERTYRKLVRYEIESCEKAQEWIDNPIKVQIDFLDTSINNPHREFSPLPLGDTALLFASLRMDSIQYFFTEEQAAELDTVVNRPKSSFFLAKQEGGKWKNQGKYSGPFLGKFGQTDTTLNEDPDTEADNDFHYGNGALSTDGKRFYFTRCETDKVGKTICEIWVTRHDSGRWNEPVKLDESINMPGYTSTMPTISSESRKDREILYFVSDREDGKGGLDIWYTMWDDRKQEFKKVKNAGTKINSMGNEITPWYDFDTRRLYFSSDGHPGLGGYDIFYTRGEKSKYEEPANMGFPLNTGVDELGYIITREPENAFFVSNRGDVGNSLQHPTCCDDIYKVKHLDYIRIIVDGELFYTPAEEETDTTKEQSGELSPLPLKDATVSLVRIDPKTGDEMPIKKTFSNENGKYYINLEPQSQYKLIASKSGFFKSEIPISSEGIVNSDTIEVEPMTLEEIPPEPMVLENIYYEYDRSNLTQDAKNTLDTTLLLFLKEKDDLVIELSSHTDSKGEDSYNQRLSQQRAESVVKYLVRKGIDPDRLVAKGYGESKPIAPNENADGSDNPEGRQKNRRTEFTVLGTTDELLEEEDEEEEIEEEDEED